MLRTLAILIAVFLTSTSFAEDRSPVTGKIARLNKMGAITVKITTGEDQGAKLFDVCDVMREQKRIGELRITKVERDHSLADITFVHPDHPLEVGDSIIVDVSLQLAQKLGSDSVVKKPAELGGQRAKIDIRSGLIRILYFGKPWSVGKPLIDDETSYPVRIAEGCIVTKDFVEFVRQYNAETRLHFKSKND